VSLLPPLRFLPVGKVSRETGASATQHRSTGSKNCQGPNRLAPGPSVKSKKQKGTQMHSRSRQRHSYGRRWKSALCRQRAMRTGEPWGSTRRPRMGVWAKQQASSGRGAEKASPWGDHLEVGELGCRLDCRPPAGRLHGMHERFRRAPWGAAPLERGAGQGGTARAYGTGGVSVIQG